MFLVKLFTSSGYSNNSSDDVNNFMKSFAQILNFEFYCPNYISFYKWCYIILKASFSILLNSLQGGRIMKVLLACSYIQFNFVQQDGSKINLLKINAACGMYEICSGEDP